MISKTLKLKLQKDFCSACGDCRRSAGRFKVIGISCCESKHGFHNQKYISIACALIPSSNLYSIFKIKVPPIRVWFSPSGISLVLINNFIFGKVSCKAIWSILILWLASSSFASDTSIKSFLSSCSLSFTSDIILLGDSLSLGIIFYGVWFGHIIKD